MDGVPAAVISSSRPQRSSCNTPARISAWVESVSRPGWTRSSSSTRSPARAISIAVAEPAHRAPTTTASYSYMALPLVAAGGRPARRRARPPGLGASDGVDVDEDRHALGDRVEDHGAVGAALHDLAQLLGGGVTRDPDAHPDLLEPVAEV